MARVLVLGSGCREHAIAWKLAQSEKVSAIFVAPGNAGTSTRKIEQLDLDIKNPVAVADWSRANEIDVVIVGPEDPLNRGIADVLKSQGIHCFGPSQAAAQIECDKSFSKNFMIRHNIPTADFHCFTSSKEAINFVRNVKWPAGCVVKAAGLAAGKGVVVTEDKEQAIQYIKMMLDDKMLGDSGSTVVLEERLEGYEVSVLAFSDGSAYRIMPPAQDHKRAFDNDEGPNTGGMGAFCPVFVEGSVMQEIEQSIIKPAIDGLKLESKPFIGVLYAGVMVTNDGPKVLEYNCRFGDPEAEVVLPLLESDLYDVVKACTSGLLDELTIKWASGSACGIVLASENYPATPKIGRKITGTTEIEETGLLVFHGGTKQQGEDIVSSGGRVLTVVAVENTLQEAAEKSLVGISKIKLQGSFFRKDIAQKELRKMLDMGLTYKQSGVDIDAGEELVAKIKKFTALTSRSGVMGGLGGFGALFDLHAAGYDRPILVSGTDGVGTKLRVALESGIFDTVGIDLVAMCVNDILVQGAEPLFFLDYFACGHLNVDLAANVIEGIAKACRESGCALVGGETAEMPGMYNADDFDLAGFAVGAVTQEHILPKLDLMKEGDILIGIPSSGVHSNGFSLIRKLISKLGLSYNSPAPFDTDFTLGQALLTPTKLYVRPLLPLIRAGLIKGMAHITGGGLLQNIPRVIPDNLGAELDANNWNLAPVFGWIQREGNVSDTDMLQTFNCGIGMVCIVEARDAVHVLNLIGTNGFPEATFIGKLTHRAKEPVVVNNFNARAVMPVNRPARKRVAVLISGSGTNLQALIDKCEDRTCPAEIVLVISNIAGVGGLDRAHRAGIETKVIPHAGKKRVTFDMEVHATLVEKKIDIVCLAGFMRIVSKEFVELWEGKLINIHPSLLPAFPGMHTHEDALNAGVRVHGCTVHFVDAGVDTGAIILQEPVPVLPDDTPTSLQERVKAQAEHKIYPLALQMLAGGRVYLDKPTKKAVWVQ